MTVTACRVMLQGAGARAGRAYGALRVHELLHPPGCGPPRLPARAHHALQVLRGRQWQGGLRDGAPARQR